MATGQIHRVLQQLRHTVLLGNGSELSDGQLLGCFVASRDEAAFAALVRRHGPMVLGVCRRITGNLQDAEDAFQATFLVLARKAASVSPRELVGNYLFGIAYRTALKARAAACRRRAREKQVKDMPQPPVEPAAYSGELHALLDQELNALPDRYRVPLVLCDLEGRTQRAVAHQLRLPVSTLSNRLATGRRLLARRLTQRGVSLSGAAVAAVLSQQAATASVPAALAAATVQAATLLTAGAATAGVISTKVIALTEGVMKVMLLSKLKTATTVLAVVGALLVGVGAVRHTPGPGEATAAAKPAPNAPAKDVREKVSAALRRQIDAQIDAQIVQQTRTNKKAADAQFLRRVYLDVTGTLPSPLEMQFFLKIERPGKRKLMVDWLLEDPAALRRIERQWKLQDIRQRREEQRDKAVSKSLEWLQKQNNHDLSRIKLQKAPDRLDQLLARMLTDQRSDTQILDALFLATLARYPDKGEKKWALAFVSWHKDRRQAFEEVLLTLVNTEEFQTNVEAMKKRLGSTGENATRWRNVGFEWFRGGYNPSDDGDW